MPVIPFTDLSLSKLAAEKQTRYLCAGLPDLASLWASARDLLRYGTAKSVASRRSQVPCYHSEGRPHKAVTIIDGNRRHSRRAGPRRGALRNTSSG